MEEREYLVIDLGPIPEGWMIVSMTEAYTDTGLTPVVRVCLTRLRRKGGKTKDLQKRVRKHSSYFLT